jgi:hypothetical protein
MVLADTDPGRLLDLMERWMPPKVDKWFDTEDLASS